MIKINFKPLQEAHFPLLLKWLQTPHVKAWWDQDVQWTFELIQEKYSSYTKGYKVEEGKPKKMHAYVIYAEDTPIGYIQLYNAYDFPRSIPFAGFPKSMAAFDMYIGESDYLRQGIGSYALTIFLENFCDEQYEAIFADPAQDNIAAIKTYEKAGFRKIKENSETSETWMLKFKSLKA